MRIERRTSWEIAEYPALLQTLKPPRKKGGFLWGEIKTKKTEICVDMWEVIGYLYDQASEKPHNPKEKKMENFEYAVTKAIQTVAEMLEISFEQAAKEALEEGPVGATVAKLVCAMAE